MKTNLERYIQQVVQGFQSNSGKGSVYCFPPISYADLVFEMLTLFFSKNPTAQVFIVVDGYNTRKAIIDKIVANEHIKNNTKILSADYIKNTYKYDYKLIITVGINDNYPIIEFLSKQCKFMLAILTKNIMDNEYITNIRNILPGIEVTVSNASVRADSIYLPVEEHRVGVVLSDKDKELYDKCSEYISTSVSIFGDLSNIEKCKIGDASNNISAADFRDTIAKQNGWSEELNTSLEWSKQIDDVYNPNVLFERANNFYNITKQRRDLVTDNTNKLVEIYKICYEHIGKKILIVSKRGEFASIVTKFLNEAGTFECADYHDSIENANALDEYGVPILVKSGKNKGEPKVIGAQAISTLNMKRFNEGMVNILSIKNSSSVKLQIAVDIVIFTTPFIDDIIAFKTRFTDIAFNAVPTINYKVYCIGTIENKHLSNQKDTSLITIIDDNENFIGYEETNDSIIL